MVISRLYKLACPQYALSCPSCQASSAAFSGRPNICAPTKDVEKFLKGGTAESPQEERPKDSAEQAPTNYLEREIQMKDEVLANLMVKQVKQKETVTRTGTLIPPYARN